MSESPQTISKEKRAILRFLSGENDNEIIKLRKAATLFGREKGDIILNDHEISSTHCQIQCISDDYYIFDMNSSNGTFVNGQRVVRAKLASGDRIAIGNTEFLLTLETAELVEHISTIFQASKEIYPNSDKTSIVGALTQHELNNTRRWEMVINVTYQDGQSEVHRVSQNLIYLGRATSFGRFEGDTEISRRHLMVKLNDVGEVFIEDQNSTNGSFLNDKRIHGIHLVAPGDEVRIGTCLFSIVASSR